VRRQVRAEARRAVWLPDGAAEQRRQPLAAALPVAPLPEPAGSCLEQAVSCPAASVRAHHSAMRAASAGVSVQLRVRVEEQAAVPQAVVPASDVPAAPRQGAAVALEVAAASGALREEAAQVASDATEVPPPVAEVVSDATGLPGVVAARHAEVAAEAAARDVAEPPRAAAGVRAEAAEALRPEEVLAAVPAPAVVVVPSVAVWVFRQGQLRPAAPRPAVRSAHEMRYSQTASRSARWSQAAQDEVWS
jgi:hypothetical protein